MVVVGGSTGLTGAPSLTAEAAMRAGAGYVRAVVPESLAPVFAQRFVEVTLSPAPCDDEGRLVPDALEVVLAAAESADAVAIGPGLGRSDGTRELVRILLDRVERPIVARRRRAVGAHRPPGMGLHARRADRADAACGRAGAAARP